MLSQCNYQKKKPLCEKLCIHTSLSSHKHRIYLHKRVSMPRRAFSRGSASSGLPISESESALKIQKAFLGFLVRKSFRKINDLGGRVKEIQRRICLEESFDLIMNKEMERMKVNEALMSLILELDSLNLFSGVRCCRKAVIKKAIALQEALDAIGAIDCPEDDADAMQVSPTVAPQNCNGDFVVIENEAEAPVSPSSGEAEIMERGDAKSYKLMHKIMSDQELLEKLKEDNQNLMKMMEEVFEMNRLQAQSISFLTARVEQLERARINDNLRKIRKQGRS
ncbi:unnamed protein product [Rhodiola kirilowii]